MRNIVVLLIGLLPAWIAATHSVAAGAPSAGAAPGLSTTCNIPVINADFEADPADSPIPGWTASQHAGTPAYQTGLDDEQPFEGRRSFHITRVTEQVYGKLWQSLPGRDLVGRPITLSAMLKTEAVGEQGWLLFLTFEGSLLRFQPSGVLDQARSQAMRGTQEWRKVSVRATVPEGTREIRFGALLLDEGRAWADAFCVAGEGLPSSP